jgi:hypothetical protein
MTCVILHIQVFALNHQRVLKNPPSARQTQFLRALGLDQSAFVDPQSKPH